MGLNVVLLPLLLVLSPALSTTCASQPSCALSTVCKDHWMIAAVVVVGEKTTYDLVETQLDNLTVSCSKNDKAYFLSPPKYRQSPEKCELVPYSREYFEQQSGYSVTTGDKDDGDTLALMLQIANTYLSKESNKPRDQQGAIVYIVTDLPCGQLNSTNAAFTIGTFIENMSDIGYQVVLVDKSDRTGCLQDSVAKCRQCRNFCNVVMASDVDSMKPVCVKHAITTVDLAILIAVGTAILIMLIVLFFYIRWRNKKKLMDKVRQKARLREQYLEAENKNKKLDSWELKPDQLEIYFHKELGSGAFAVVFEGKLTGRRPVDETVPTAQRMGSRSNKVAVKRVPPHADHHCKRDFLDEVNFMKKLGYHSHVLGMIGCMTTVDLPLMVLEYCENGDLLGFLKRNRDGFDVDGSSGVRAKDLLSIAWQVADGMCYIKSLGLIHSDLSSRNILLTKDLSAKISDFGLCRQSVTSDSSQVYISRGGRLPVKWIAIESLRHFQFSFQADIWSLGVVLWEMFSLGETPYADVNPTAMLEHLTEGERLPSLPTMSPSIYKLMSDCWREAPDERPTVEEVRNRLSEMLSTSSYYYGYLSMSDCDEDMRL